MKTLKTIFTILAFLVSIISCKKDDDPGNTGSPQEPQLTSAMFTNNGVMPQEIGKNKGNASPQLTIKNVPAGTVEMAITMRDKSNNDSWHWVVWGIPATKTDIVKKETWSGLGVTVGNNDYGSGYIGPFPPAEHEYVITVYFLKQKITLSATQYKSLPTQMTGKIISQASLTGRYTP